MNSNQNFPADHWPPVNASAAEVAAWRPRIHARALHRRVLAVATTRIEGAWAAYVAPVIGQDHRTERGSVLANGCKLDENVARVIFPEFDGIRYSA